MIETRDEQQLPVTIPGIKPGDVPLGSLKSRAAARSMFCAREAAEGMGLLFQLQVIGRSSQKQTCTCKRPPAGPFALCGCFYLDESADANRFRSAQC